MLPHRKYVLVGSLGIPTANDLKLRQEQYKKQGPTAHIGAQLHKSATNDHIINHSREPRGEERIGEHCHILTTQAELAHRLFLGSLVRPMPSRDDTPLQRFGFKMHAPLKLACEEGRDR